jgi:hypothetical protein
MRHLLTKLATCLVWAVAASEGCGGSASGPAAPSVTAVPPAVAGMYRLTFTASDTCVPDSFYNGTLGVPATLPASAKSRTYVATITQEWSAIHGARLHVDLSGAEFVRGDAVYGPVPQQRGNAFGGEIPYNGFSFRDAVWLTLRGGDPGDLTVAIDLGEGREWEEHDLLERIAPTTFLGISGTALGTLTSSTIEGTLDGTFWLYSYGGSGDLYRSPDTRLIASCKSSAHRFVFERTNKV